MKKILLTAVCAGAMMVSAFAQLLDEKNVTITMDLQPVLQLSLQGPDQIDFTFDNINSYYAGITKYGANILRVSASVSFDLWAAGLSLESTGASLWDNVVPYNNGANLNSLNAIPLTALELRQFPANPMVEGAAPLCPQFSAAESDYSTVFPGYDFATNAFAAGACGGLIYVPGAANPYLPPASLGATTTASEKYIAGASTAAAGEGCAIAGGSYLSSAFDPATGTFTTGGAGTDGGYFFVMDYRILPGLPVKFPAHFAAAANNSTAPSVVAAAGASGLTVAGVDYAAPGVYTMYIKYILVEDQ